MRALERLAGVSWRPASGAPRRHGRAGWVVGIALVAAVTGAIELLKPHAPASGLGVLYLLAVLPAAVFWGTAVALGVSLSSAAVLAFYSLDVSKPADGVALGVFVLTALVVSELSARSVREARVAQQLAEEQAALRRIATLVARGVPSAELFSAVADEMARLLPADSTFVAHVEPDSSFVVLAIGGLNLGGLAPGERRQTEPPGPIAEVVRTGQPARTDDFEQASAELRERIRRTGVRSSVVTPIVVEGHLWGVIAAASKRGPFPIDTELRMLNFTELVATAIANAESRSELAASRARIVAASDETRRQVERDLHDGAQQRLVTLGLALRSAQAELPHDLEEVRAELSDVGQGLTAVLDDLREISRGIHPAILSEGGLAPALKTLVRRSTVPTALDVRVEGRLPEGVEVAAYYVVSESLTNASKHAQASAVYVDVARTGDVLHISVRDDGVGGADPAGGSGLIGLRDRVEALGGTIAIRSAKGAGTEVEVMLSLDQKREPSGRVHDARRRAGDHQREARQVPGSPQGSG
jgi:signal transduction histidine kinase